MATITRQPISIRGGFRPGETVIERLDISVRLPRSRKAQRRIGFLSLFFSVCTLLTAYEFPMYVVGMVILFAILAVIWCIFDGCMRLMSPQYTELVVTNQRLLLRAGPRFVAWVSNYDSEIEVLVREESSAFAVRPKIEYCSPGEVYVKSVSPFQQGKQLADLMRSFSGNASLAGRSPGEIAGSGKGIGSAERFAPAVSIASGAKVSLSLPASLLSHLSPRVPPGIAVTHAFLSHQLRSLIASIPVSSVLPVVAVLPSAEALSARSDASQNTESPAKTEPPELGNTGYQFGVDK